MSNYKSVPYNNAEDDLKLVYDDILNTLKITELPNWVVYLGESPGVLAGFWSMFKSVSCAGRVPSLLLELIYFTVAYHRHAPYCIELHASNALRLTHSLGFDDLEKIASQQSNGILPESYEVAIAVAAELDQKRCIAEPQMVERLRDVNFDQLQIMDIFTAVSIAQMFNTYTFAAALPIDQDIIAPRN